MNKKVILVTGGAGYIGSHVCKALKNSGFIPLTYDNLSSGNIGAVQWGAFEQGDIRDQENLSAIINKYKPIAIMHFASLIQVGDSVVNPADYYSNNVLGSYNLLEAARENSIKHIVFSSTAAVYGIPTVKLIKESSTLSPINPYGHTKLTMESMARDYAHAYGMHNAILRYFNAAGADLDADTGSAYPRDTHIIPLLMQVAAKTMPEIKIFGTDYDTEDGSAVRDYIHVKDLADAHVKSLEYILEHDQSITLNLGTNCGHSVKEVIECVRSVTKENIKSVECDRRQGDPEILVADASKARELLGWNPEYSDLETIISSAWKWKCKQLENNVVNVGAK
ncbi:MAG: UDP-glucose 4-epimerase GalE [Alphaproteobacteria bacterium]|nr:MAG: UDP-glucose 4-epimerase GalE [Alphaproteobacteria bacterium]